MFKVFFQFGQAARPVTLDNVWLIKDPMINWVEKLGLALEKRFRFVKQPALIRISAEN